MNAPAPNGLPPLALDRDQRLALLDLVENRIDVIAVTDREDQRVLAVLEAARDTLKAAIPAVPPRRLPTYRRRAP